MRHRLVGLGLVFVLSTGACGDGAEIDVRSGSTDGAAPAETSLPDGHRVDVRNVTIVGPLSEVLDASVVTDKLVIFPIGEPARLDLAFTATEDVELVRLPWYSGVAPSTQGGGVLGHRGVCGSRWDEEGRPLTDDPCPAADPAVLVPAGSTQLLPIFLHRVTDIGAVAPGAYPLEVALDGDTVLELDVELRSVACHRGPATTLAFAPGAGGGEYVCNLE